MLRFKWNMLKMVHSKLLKKVRSHSIPRFWDPTGIGIVICGIVLGMRYVHSKGFIHRDLKPSTILINELGYAMISDFGTTRSEYDDRTWTSDTGSVHYAAPEMYREGEITRKADVFSFGLIAYELLVGRPVFHYSEMPFPIMRKVLNGEMPVIPGCVGKVIQSLITRCWSKRPDDRPSFDDIVDEFEREHFNVFPGAASRKIFEYVRSVLDWEICNVRSDRIGNLQ
jgi:serine/threonine protein kinase